MDAPPYPPDVARLSGREARALIRGGRWRGPTVSLARGWAQANLVVLPNSLAPTFASFCALNPRSCPLLDTTLPGSAEPPRVAPGADLRVDLPRYRVYRHGILTGGVTPQAVAQEAGVELMLTHAPAHMFVTDLRDEDLVDRGSGTPFE